MVWNHNEQSWRGSLPWELHHEPMPLSTLLLWSIWKAGQPTWCWAVRKAASVDLGTSGEGRKCPCQASGWQPSFPLSISTFLMTVGLSAEGPSAVMLMMGPDWLEEFCNLQCGLFLWVSLFKQQLIWKQLASCFLWGIARLDGLSGWTKIPAQHRRGQRLPGCVRGVCATGEVQCF